METELRIRNLYFTSRHIRQVIGEALELVYATRQNRSQPEPTESGAIIYRDVTVSCAQFLYAQARINKLLHDLVSEIDQLRESLKHGNSDTNGGNNQTQTDATATGDDARNVAHQSAG